MTPGEPLEETQDAGGDTVDAILLESPPYGPGRSRDVELADTVDLLSQARDGDGDGPDEAAMDTEDMASLDAEVHSLLHAMAEEESQHDEAWVAASRREGGEPYAEGTPDTDDANDADRTDDADREDGTDETEHADGPSTPDTPAPSVDDANDPVAIALPVEEDPAPRAREPHAPADTMPDRDALRALDALGERFEAAEARNDEALGKIGHALGMIATRIDGLEARATDRTIADVAFVAAPPEDEDEEDASVAPYIARAERELKAKKESGSMDIFDRIARAAETEFDDHAGSSPARVVANAGDGRRVGTKRWQPSKAVKKRMEQLEKARAADGADPAPRPDPAPAARGLRVENEDMTAPRAAPGDDPLAPMAGTEAEAARAPDGEMHDDDAGLSVLPGARGRRRNRARKSMLDEDFENVFAEEGDKPSIQSLRRKMRERPVEAPEEEKRGGMLSGMLGKRSARKDAGEADMADTAAPASDAGEDGDEDDLRTAFDEALGDAPALAAPGKAGKRAKGKAKAKAGMADPIDIDIDDDLDDEDEDWDDGEGAQTDGNRRKALVGALVVAAAGAGFVVWKAFLA